MLLSPCEAVGRFVIWQGQYPPERRQTWMPANISAESADTFFFSLILTIHNWLLFLVRWSPPIKLGSNDVCIFSLWANLSFSSTCFTYIYILFSTYIGTLCLASCVFDPLVNKHLNIVSVCTLISLSHSYLISCANIEMYFCFKTEMFPLVSYFQSGKAPETFTKGPKPLSTSAIPQ